jgi:hypothetical protein
MKRFYHLIIAGFCLLLPQSRLIAQHNDNRHPCFSITYIVDSCSIMVDNSLVTASGSFDIEGSLEHPHPASNFAYPMEEYGIEFFQGKWRFRSTPVHDDYESSDYGPPNRWNNALNNLDDSNSIVISYDHVFLHFRIRSMDWIDTLDHSRKMLVVNMVTDRPDSVRKLLYSIDSLVQRSEFSQALELLTPLRKDMIYNPGYCFFDYYYDWLIYRQNEQESALHPVKRSRKKRGEEEPEWERPAIENYNYFRTSLTRFSR